MGVVLLESVETKAGPAEKVWVKVVYSQKPGAKISPKKQENSPHFTATSERFQRMIVFRIRVKFYIRSM